MILVTHTYKSYRVSKIKKSPKFESSRRRCDDTWGKHTLVWTVYGKIFIKPH